MTPSKAISSPQTSSRGSLELAFPPVAAELFRFLMITVPFAAAAYADLQAGPRGFSGYSAATDIRDAMMSGAFLGAVGGAALYYLIRFLRQPGSARIEWDESGITEWAGERVRIKIPWSEARRSMFKVEVHYQGPSGSDRGTESYQVLQIRSPQGTITVVGGGGKQGVLRHGWLRFRRCHTQSIAEIVRATDHLPDGEPLARDGRLKSHDRLGWRALSVVGHLIAMVGFAFLALQSYHLTGRDDGRGGAQLVLIAACILSLRVAPLVVECLRRRATPGDRRAAANELALRVAEIACLCLPAIRAL
jgi:hypothetical protein